MRFYFKKEALKKHLRAIYWRELTAFLEKQNETINGTQYSFFSCGEDEKTCLLYENFSEKNAYNCDFYIALDSTLKIPKEDFYLGSVLDDEKETEGKCLCLLPIGNPLMMRKNADEIWIIVEEESSPESQLKQHEVCSLAKVHGIVKVFEAHAFEGLDDAVLKKTWSRCKKLISFSKNKALNHWFCLLLGEDFILYKDDASSPIRYAITHREHPFLQDRKGSEYDESCFYKYSIWTSSLRKLNIQLQSPQKNNDISWSPQDALMYLVEQCLGSKAKKENTLFRHLKTDHCTFPFALPTWQKHKDSLPQLMDFLEKHPTHENMHQLLATYLLNVLPQEHWYKIEYFFANKEAFLNILHKTVDALEEMGNVACSLDLAYGTYVRSVCNQQKYICGWNQNLATCFDLCLCQKFDKLIRFVKPAINKKLLSGVKLTKLLLTPLLVLKKNIPNELINICKDLIALEDSKEESTYGEKIFYTALLYLLAKDHESLKNLLTQEVNVVKTQGYLGCFGLFLIKFDPHYFDAGERYLYLEEKTLLAKKPFMLQMKALGMLTIGDEKGYAACMQLLTKERDYFKSYDTCPEKWLIQSQIEEILGNKIRAKRFRFLHDRMGISPCLWELFA